MSLSLGNVNDYLAPSQLCVKTTSKEEISAGPKEAKIEIGENTGIYYEINSSSNTKKQLDAVTINLDDCLACSGCVTSTETMLVTSLTYNKVVEVLKGLQGEIHDGECKFSVSIASISPQTVASFAAKYSLSFADSFKRIEFFLRSQGVTEVLDSNIGRNFSLLECARDFVERYMRSDGIPEGKVNLPLFTSSCPGWICYAEKVYNEFLPLITTAKSPQQIMGSFVKDYIPKVCSIRRESIYHFSVMPCYDKKLESMRKDFEFDEVKDVDCVITSTELESMMKECNFNFEVSNIEPQYLINKYDTPNEISTSSIATVCNELKETFPLYIEGSSSGGYQSFVMRYAAKHLFNIDLSPNDIDNGSELVKVRNLQPNNCTEYVLEDKESKNTLLRFYRVYGFKNLQSVIRAVRKITAAPPKLNLIPISNNSARRSRVSTFSQNMHFVELMVCPSGCINGAGQLKEETSSSSAQIGLQPLTIKAEALYLSSKNDDTDKNNKTVFQLYQDWLHASKKSSLLHTQYHAALKNDFLQMKW